MDDRYSIVHLFFLSSVPFFITLGLFFFARDVGDLKKKRSILITATVIIIIGLVLAIDPTRQAMSDSYRVWHNLSDRAVLAHYGPIVGNVGTLLLFAIGVFFLFKKPGGKKGRKTL